ncbi:MAG TPA: hypothetical protein VGL77_18975 [Armatimonadota bacterium]|jgi:hypothetical protein
MHKEALKGGCISTGMLIWFIVIGVMVPPIAPIVIIVLLLIWGIGIFGKDSNR